MTGPTQRAATTPSAPARTKRRRKRGRGVTYTVNMIAVIVAVLFAFPIYWMFNTAFKSANEYQTLTPRFWPHEPTLVNFTSAFDVGQFGDDLRNSLILTIVSVVFSIIIGFLGALAIARFRFAGRKTLIFVIMVVQMLPMAVMVVPIYKVLADAHQTNTLTGMIVIYIGLVMPYTVWTLRGFIVNVPKELDEAAMVDGCSRWQTFFRIILPLVGPGLVATSVYGCIQIWNEWLVIYTINVDNKKQNLMVWLTDQSTLHGTAWGPLMAGAIITSLPVVILFLVIQRHIATGLTAGAVKG